MSKTIHYYFSPISPFAYLAGDQLEKEAKGTIIYHPFDLPKLFSATGAIPLPQRSQQRKDYRYVELKRIAKRRGLPINLNPAHFPTNGRLASCLILAARESGQDAGSLIQALLRAVWIEELDISDLNVLTTITAAQGLNPELLDNLDRFDALLDQETDQAINAGVFGSPFYIVDGEPFWGQDKLDEALAAANA